MANVKLKELAKKDLTQTLSPEEAEVLYSDRRQWRQELMVIAAEGEGRRAAILESLAIEVERYEKIVGGGSLAELAIIEYHKKLRKLDNHLLRVQKRIVEIDRSSIIQAKEIPEINFFVAAITEHRRLILKSGREPEDHDIALWSALEGEWRFS